MTSLIFDVIGRLYSNDQEKSNIFDTPQSVA